MVVAQIYCMQSLEDSVAVASAGADHVGCMASFNSIPYSVKPALARKMSKAVRPDSKLVVIPLSHDPAEILELARLSEPDLVQLANDAGKIGVEDFAALSRELLRMGFRVIKVIAVGGGNELEEAKAYAAHADIVMFDSLGPPPSDALKGYIGGTGRPHDWSISARLARKIDKPVILAGGLNIENITAAMDKVRPWGVDAATSLDVKGSGGKKDLTKVKEFVRLVKDFGQ